MARFFDLVLTETLDVQQIHENCYEHPEMVDDPDAYYDGGWNVWRCYDIPGNGIDDAILNARNLVMSEKEESKDACNA